MLDVATIEEMSRRVHTANAKWWADLDTGAPLTRNVGELLMLCVSELAEAMEGDRKDLMDDKLSHRKMFEVELADALIRTLDIIGGLQLQVVPRINVPDFLPYNNVGQDLLQITSCYVAAYLFVHDRHVWVSDALWNLLEYADYKDVDIFGAYEEKMAYNAQRADHSIEGRKAAGGKKY